MILANAIRVVGNVVNQGTNSALQALRTVTVVGLLINISNNAFTRTELPKFTGSGAVYVMLLVAASWLIDQVIGKMFQGMKYKLKFAERARNI